MPDPQEKTFLGQGWFFPVQPSQDKSDISLAAYEEDIRQAIRIILETDRGERVMRPDFGAGLRALVFEPLNTTTMALIKHRVQEALITWEPRIQVQEVKVTVDGTARNRVNIEIVYQVRRTNVFYNLVYPFYLQEAR
ncbi:MAG: GPW/gp25 family protein [Desulfobaccales bacterium]